MATQTMERADTKQADSDAADKTGQPEDRKYLPESWIGDPGRDAASTLWRLRRQAGPHAVTGIVAGGGLAAQAVTASGVSTPGQVALLLALGAFPTAATIAGVVYKRRRTWGRRVLLGGLAAAAWLTFSPYGAGPEQITALVACEYALAARWWQVNRLGYPSAPAGDVPYTPPEEMPPGEDEQILGEWQRYVACTGGPLPGSALMLPEKTRHGWAFTGLFARGKQDLTTAISALVRIAGALDLTVTDIIIESHPILKSDARFRFQVITDSPIVGAVNFTGPRRAGEPGYGLLGLGPYADGSGEAAWRLYTPGSMWSGAIIGGTGIGKSRVVENIVISALSGGDTDYIYLDPNRGGSSPTLAEHAHWFGTTDDADDILNAVLAILDARGDENAVEGWTGFTPSPRRPGILIVVEECHRPFADPKKAALWARVAREGRKVGIALLCVSQYPGLVTFGNNEALRSSVMEGNAIVLRSTSNQTKQLMAGLQVDPRTLPKIPGYAYMQGSDETGTRTAPFRNRDTDPTSDGGVAAYWISRQPRPGLDVLSQTATLAAGTAYQDRNVSTDTGRAAARARVDELRGGHLPAGMLKGDAASAATASTVDGGELGVIITFPPAVTADDLRRPATATEASKHGLSGSPKAVYDAITAGASRPKEVELATGLSHRRVAEILAELVVAGHLIQPRYGRYQRAA